MPYEVFRSKAARLGTPGVTIGTDGRLSFNADAGDILHATRAKFVQILWDSEARKVALRPLSKRDETAYALTAMRGNRRGMNVSAVSFLRTVGFDLSKRRNVAVTWNAEQKLLEFVLPETKAAKK